MFVAKQFNRNLVLDAIMRIEKWLKVFLLSLSLNDVIFEIFFGICSDFEVVSPFVIANWIISVCEHACIEHLRINQRAVGLEISIPNHHMRIIYVRFVLNLMRALVRYWRLQPTSADYQNDFLLKLDDLGIAWHQNICHLFIFVELLLWLKQENTGKIYCFY